MSKIWLQIEMEAQENHIVLSKAVMEDECPFIIVRNGTKGAIVINRKLTGYKGAWYFFRALGIFLGVMKRHPINEYVEDLDREKSYCEASTYADARLISYILSDGGTYEGIITP